MSQAASPPIFQHRNGQPVNFYFHRSIRSEGSRLALRDQIERHGGRVVLATQEADTVLVDPDHLYGQSIEILQLGYSIDPNKKLHKIFVEPRGFIKFCIARQQKYAHLPPKRQGMGGPARGFRRDFTRKDDKNLAWYISRRCPDPKSGGRTGNGIYQELMALEHLYPWVNHHTWQSWRERYKKNKERFDDMIRYNVVEDPPDPKALYHLDRQLVHRRKNFEIDSDDQGEDSDAEIRGEELHPHNTELKEEGPGDDMYILDDEPAFFKPEALAHPINKRARPFIEEQLPSPRARKRQRHSLSASRHTQDPATDEDKLFSEDSLFGESPYEDDLAGPSNTQATLVNGSQRSSNGGRGDESHLATQITLIGSPTVLQNTKRNRRSMGPMSSISPPPARSTLSEKAKGKQREIFDVDNNVQLPMISFPHEVPGENTQDEERDIEAFLLSANEVSAPLEHPGSPAMLLVASTAVSQVDPGPSPVVTQPESVTPPTTALETLRHISGGLPTRSLSVRQESLETDDGQTRRALGLSTLRISQRASVSLDAPGVEQKTIRNRSPFIQLPPPRSRRGKSPALIPKWRMPQPMSPSMHTASSSRIRTPASFASTPRPRTPQRSTAFLRNESVSSVEGLVFPSSGTRARDARDRFEEAEKHVIWEPPMGTRAAKMLRNI